MYTKTSFMIRHLVSAKQWVKSSSCLSLTSSEGQIQFLQNNVNQLLQLEAELKFLFITATVLDTKEALSNDRIFISTFKS